MPKIAYYPIDEDDFEYSNYGSYVNSEKIVRKKPRKSNFN